MCGLPPELKGHIARSVGNDAAEDVATLRALGSTSRAFNDSCAPLVWETLTLDKQRNPKLFMFLREILPKHAEQIKTLLLNCHGICMYLRRGTEEEVGDPVELAIVVAAERMEGVSREGEKPNLRTWRAYNTLVWAIMRAYHNITSLRMDVSNPTLNAAPGRSYAWRDDEPPDPVVEHARTQWAPQLHSLDLRCDSDEAVDVPALLTACVNLRVLKLRTSANAGRCVHRRSDAASAAVPIPSALAGLAHLESLELEHAIWTPSLYPLTLSSTLRHLSLLSFADLNQQVLPFLNRHPSLTHLHLTFPFKHGPSSPPTFLSLPHVKHLSLTAVVHGALLTSFHTLEALETLHIAQHARVPIADWAALVRALPALKVVHVEKDLPGRVAQGRENDRLEREREDGRVLAAACEEQGVRLEWPQPE
ncbi:hypothetical protein JCM10450v2_003693 [Rhodotorula kratochvilovae]